MKWLLAFVIAALAFPVASPALEVNVAAESPVGVWKRPNFHWLTLNADGSAKCKSGATWKWISKEERRFEVTFTSAERGGPWVLTMAKDGLTLEGTTKSGSPLKYDRVDAAASAPPKENPIPTVGVAPPPPAPSSQGAAPQATNLVREHRSNLVFVTTPDGAGSGFIASYGNGNYLITNAHVAAGSKGATFKTLDGTVVQTGAPAVAVGHDIFMMALKPGGAPFQVMAGVDQNAEIGDDVVVLGNAEGAGVVNTINGRIVGLGPNLVEVSAPFQPGNSGSPIIHLKSGKVIGVATYLTIRKYDAATKKPVKEPVIRRFGYRLDSIKAWEPVNWPTFFAQAAEMGAVEKLTDDLVAFLNDIGRTGRVTRGAHTNPVIRQRIDAWLDTKAKGLSARDATVAGQNLISFLKVTSQSDITAAQQRVTHDYFRRKLADQQKERTEISEILGKMIEGSR